mmetsp:Transcript_80713/g.187379  ORF Transcript_80713/g.187379 Transcript_80713/m.187379 type:complete len:246 (+) Transcript_80713:1265-2002(+)
MKIKCVQIRRTSGVTGACSTALNARSPFSNASSSVKSVCKFAKPQIEWSVMASSVTQSAMLISSLCFVQRKTEGARMCRKYKPNVYVTKKGTFSMLHGAMLSSLKTTWASTSTRSSIATSGCSDFKKLSQHDGSAALSVVFSDVLEHFFSRGLSGTGIVSGDASASTLDAVSFRSLSSGTADDAPASMLDAVSFRSLSSGTADDGAPAKVSLKNQMSKKPQKICKMINIDCPTSGRSCVGRKSIL